MKLSYRVAELCAAMNGQAQHVSPDLRVESFTTNSRDVQAGDWFVCLQGEHTDGHQYAAQALRQGASGLIVSAERLPAELRSAPHIVVSSPNQALLDWGADFRNRFDGTVLGITGSNGKTTAKEIARQLCAHWDPQAHATAGNFNNFIGVPLTLLSAPLDADWWIVEMGTNRFGEIATLSEIVRPTVGLLTSIGESHLEFLESTAGVAREKAGICAGMSAGSDVWVPAKVLEREILEAEIAQAGMQLRTFGVDDPDADWNLSVLSIGKSPTEPTALLTPLGEVTTSLQSPLALQNLAGVLAALHSCGVAAAEVPSAVAALQLEVAGRMQFVPREQTLWVNDSYNANPSSFRSVLESLRKMFPSRRLLLAAGDMAELGAQAPQLHQAVGRFAAEVAVAEIFACGQFAEDYVRGWQDVCDRPAHTASTPRELLPAVQQRLLPDDILLVKGSRSARMEVLFEQER
jgi:UDP-N-acetylmuramoyl-tripeptide--D-alanyl-D-alanine ligase